MIGSQPQHQGIRVLFGQQQRSHGHRRRRIAPDRLQHDTVRLDVQRVELFGNQETMLVVADHHRRGKAFSGHPQGGVLKHASLGMQGQELLGIGFARQWPKAGAGAAGKNDRMNSGDGFLCISHR